MHGVKFEWERMIACHEKQCVLFSLLCRFTHPSTIRLSSNAPLSRGTRPQIFTEEVFPSHMAITGDFIMF